VGEIIEKNIMLAKNALSIAFVCVDSKDISEEGCVKVSFDRLIQR